MFQLYTSWKRQKTKGGGGGGRGVCEVCERMDDKIWWPISFPSSNFTLSIWLLYIRTADRFTISIWLTFLVVKR